MKEIEQMCLIYEQLIVTTLKCDEEMRQTIYRQPREDEEMKNNKISKTSSKQ